MQFINIFDSPYLNYESRFINKITKLFRNIYLNEYRKRRIYNFTRKKF